MAAILIGSAMEQNAAPHETRNYTRSPLLELPDEILSEVFLHCADGIRKEYYQCFPDETAVLGPFTWLTVAHVCRHWRVIALVSPRLWSHIDVRREDRTTEFLRRSGEVPLSIYHHDHPYSEKALRLVFENIPRIRVLIVSTSHFPFANPPLDICTVSPDTPLILEKLKLSVASIDFVKTIVLPRLTHLKIGRSRGTVGEWADLLSGLPAFTELELISCVMPLGEEIAEISSNSSSSSRRLVTLPRLRYLHLSGDNAGIGIAILLYRLGFPSSAAVHFDAHFVDVVPETVDALPRIFDAFASGVRRSTDGEERQFKSLRLYSSARWVPDKTLVFETWPVLRDAEALNNDYSERTSGLFKLSCSCSPTFTWRSLCV
ncbi:uncharacterized protein PHACADRAFT_149521 [Phanerochaete carnosa HHB-10118-sp]|uniref:F-box domain-containing protein n=1 Tax=Phanerochaete carnosa (strain HHB-10118-sp) TaxID=650164 RepID=K5WQN3_PHACS|nr:uncharacterized protein PHACADRAFT_149521 [Phanerochaete carnosa HHB-10118-sp]EKM52672.1 hypothetical protein PHACADRAFT_149521 [Phanerochaete carnosa HHB-10118-sp]